MSEKTTSIFDYNAIPAGFYHTVAEGGNPIRRAWHLQKFERVLECLPEGPNLSVLDIGCFAGTFLSFLPPDRFSRQVGVDILPAQIAYANERFSTTFREFRLLSNIQKLNEIEETFDCITVIEVIEHLEAREIALMFEQLQRLLKPGGRLVLSTPNYTSAWPLIEIVLNAISDISYEEQHLTKFNFFGVQRKLSKLFPDLQKSFEFRFKTTTHFISPFLAWVSLPFARRISNFFPHTRWHFPFGNLILLQYAKR